MEGRVNAISPISPAHRTAAARRALQQRPTRLPPAQVVRLHVLDPAQPMQTQLTFFETNLLEVNNRWPDSRTHTGRPELFAIGPVLMVGACTRVILKIVASQSNR